MLFIHIFIEQHSNSTHKQLDSSLLFGYPLVYQNVRQAYGLDFTYKKKNKDLNIVKKSKNRDFNCQQR